MAADCVTLPLLADSSRGSFLQTCWMGVWVIPRWQVPHVWLCLWCLRRNTAVGGNGGTVVAAAHKTQLSRQIGEQLLRAICLTSYTVEAGEKGSRTALPTDSHQGFGLCHWSCGLCPCLLGSSGSQMVVVRHGERLASGDVAQWYHGCRSVCSLPAKGYPLLVPRAGEVSWACFS